MLAVPIHIIGAFHGELVEIAGGHIEIQVVLILQTVVEPHDLVAGPVGVFLRRLLLGQAGLDPRLLEGIIRMGAAY